MSRFLKFLALACCAVSFGVSADEDLAMGKLLVATDEVRGPYFAESVVLLLHYDEQGAQGLVINRQMDAELMEVFPESESLAGYSGTLYWGGPVKMSTMRALLRTDTPPRDAVHIFGAVHQVPFDDTLPASTSNSANLRFFVGYAGWMPGQLERELGFGSWHVLSATEEVVFAEDPSMIWHYLSPPREYRAATGKANARARDPAVSNEMARSYGVTRIFSRPSQ